METHVRWFPVVVGTFVLVGWVCLNVIAFEVNSIGSFEDAKLRQLPESLLDLG